MTLAADEAIALPRLGRSLTRGDAAALAVIGAGLVTALLTPYLPWLAVWPEAWALPVTAFISDWLGAGLEAAKPAARAMSEVLGYPMTAAGWVLTGLPWPGVLALFLALGWWVGGAGMVALTAACLGFVLVSGHWVASMNTLALVAVSVPLALALGLATGILAWKVRAVRAVVETMLDIMQTVPTFAYLTPLLVLFGFGPVVGLIASAIYAAPPMARNVMLGLQRVDPEIREAAAMSGATGLQQLVLVEIPAASQQIMLGVNQCVMAALSMVIIAAVIGGFDDIGWAVLLTMRKAQFGDALVAGMVIVLFAVLIDRLTARLAEDDRRFPWVIPTGAAAVVAMAALVFATSIPDPESLDLMQPVATGLDAGLTDFTRSQGQALTDAKNLAMFYGLLPLRIGLDDAVLDFTWGWTWTWSHSAWFLGISGALAGLLALRGSWPGAAVLMAAAWILHSGVTHLPWPAALVAVGGIGWRAGGWRLAALGVLSLAAILVSGLWERAMLSVYLSGTSVMVCAVLGGLLGLAGWASRWAWAVLRPVCDILQTIPLFVFLIPVLMIFQIGEFSAFLAIIAYAIVPMIRYTRHGLVSTPVDLVEAATASGCTPLQMLVQVRLPWAMPTILLGLKQTILYAFAMLVIAALIGTTGLGQSIYIALGQADLGLGIAAGVAMALLALVADRLVQGFATEQRKALGL